VAAIASIRHLRQADLEGRDWARLLMATQSGPIANASIPLLGSFAKIIHQRPVHAVGSSEPVGTKHTSTPRPPWCDLEFKAKVSGPVPIKMIPSIHFNV